MLGSYAVRERYMEARRACSGQPPPACCAICNGNFQLALSRLLKPGSCGGFSSLMTLTLSAAHRASLRRIVENAGSSVYAKSSAFSLGVLGHILRIILRLAIVRGNLVLPRIPRIFGQNGSYQRPCRGIFVPRLQPALTIARRSDFRQNRSSASSIIRVGCSRSTVRYTLGPVGSTLTNGFGTRKRHQGGCSCRNRVRQKLRPE